MTKSNKLLLQLAIEGTDTVIDIHRVTGVKSDMPTLFTIERMVNGEHRLTYNAIQIPDLTKVQGLRFIRQKEDDE